MNSPNSLRFGVIGCGRMGTRVATFMKKDPRCDMICCADDVSIVSENFSSNFGCAPYTDYRKMLENEDFNVAIVALPNKLHAEVSIDCIEQGKHVLCEKPLAPTLNEARAMVRAARKNGVFLKTASNVRFFQSVMAAKNLLDRKKIGRVLFFRGSIGHSGWNLRPGSWYTNAELIGGGTLLDNGCHLVDIMRWFTGDVRECIGHKANLFHKLKGLEDNAFGILIGVDGCVSALQSSWTEWGGYLHVELYGSEGIIRIDNRGASEVTTVQNREGMEVERFDFSGQPSHSLQRETDDFVNCLLNNKQPLPSGYDGMKVVQVIQALYRSAETGRRVFLEEDEEARSELAVTTSG